MADYNSKYSGEQVEALLDQVASGNTGGGGGSINEVYIADFTRESLKNGMNNGTNVECDMPALIAAMNANKIILVREAEDPSYQGVYVLNGYAEDLLYFSIVDTYGSILWCEGTDYNNSQFIDAQSLHERNWGSKQDTLVSGENIKTINGESIVGEGDITIAGGSGEKGDKGDKGDTGVGVASVAQTTTSNADGGSNVVTVTLTDGTKSTFTVKNGSKGSQGSQGIQGEQGPKGDKGDKGDTGANGTNGTNGVSVSSVKQTTTSTADGGTNVVTVTLSNGTTSTFSVKNGSKGSNGSNGTNGKDGADGATFTPSVDSAGNLSWTNNKGLTNPQTVNIKGPKGDAGEGGGSGGGKEVNTDYGAYIEQAEPNKIYIMSGNSASGLFIVDLLIPEDALYCEYTFIFDPGTQGLLEQTEITVPDYVVWANGQIPDLSLADTSKTYELSIVGWRHDHYEDMIFHAVLTPFKPA